MTTVRSLRLWIAFAAIAAVLMICVDTSQGQTVCESPSISLSDNAVFIHVPDGVNLRSGPGTNFAVVSKNTLTSTDFVAVPAADLAWWKILRYLNGERLEIPVYVSVQLVTRQIASCPQGTPEVTAEAAIVADIESELLDRSELNNVTETKVIDVAKLQETPVGSNGAILIPKSIFPNQVMIDADPTLGNRFIRNYQDSLSRLNNTDILDLSSLELPTYEGQQLPWGYISSQDIKKYGLNKLGPLGSSAFVGIINGKQMISENTYVWGFQTDYSNSPLLMEQSGTKNTVVNGKSLNFQYFSLAGGKIEDFQTISIPQSDYANKILSSPNGKVVILICGDQPPRNSGLDNAFDKEWDKLINLSRQNTRKIFENGNIMPGSTEDTRYLLPVSISVLGI